MHANCRPDDRLKICSVYFLSQQISSKNPTVMKPTIWSASKRRLWWMCFVCLGDWYCDTQGPCQVQGSRWAPDWGADDGVLRLEFLDLVQVQPLVVLECYDVRRSTTKMRFLQMLTFLVRVYEGQSIHRDSLTGYISPGHCQGYSQTGGVVPKTKSGMKWGHTGHSTMWNVNRNCHNGSFHTKKGTSSPSVDAPLHPCSQSCWSLLGITAC